MTRVTFLFEMGLPENMVPQKPVAITICHTELPYFGAKTYFQTHPYPYPPYPLLIG